MAAATGDFRSVKPGERVLITGGTGSLGNALATSLTNSGVSVRIFSRDEKKQYDMQKVFPECEYVLGDIRNPETVRDAVRDVDVVIHGASLKYVNIGELQPLEYVQTNVNGTINVMNAVLAEDRVRRCVGISSDKACMPVNTYGMTKAILEKLLLEGSRRQGEQGGTIFNVARYGNVLGTRGSVVPFWRECLAQDKVLPVTNPNMTRFFFTIEEAVMLIDYCLRMPEGLIISKRMNACTLEDLADTMAGDKGWEVVGERPGEKLHEQLLSEDEMRVTSLSEDEATGELYWVMDPKSQKASGDIEEFNSNNAPRLNKDQIADLLRMVK